MSTEVLLRWLAAIALPMTLTWDIYKRKRTEARGDGEQGRPRYGAYLDAALLPMYFCMLAPILLLFTGAEGAAHALLSVGFDVFFQTGIYFAVLLLVLPLLRRYISARVCATLWLLPNYLYIVQGVNMRLPRRPLGAACALGRRGHCGGGLGDRFCGSPSVESRLPLCVPGKDP